MINMLYAEIAARDMRAKRLAEANKRRLLRPGKRAKKG